MTCYTSEKKVKSVAFASFVLLLTKHRSNKQDGYLDMSNPGALFLDYSYSRCAIPVLVKFQDGSKPLEASSITEAGFWLEENVGIVKGGAWSMGVRNVLMGRRTEYRGVTAEYLDPERKCKGVCSRCERYLNLRESEHWDGDICAVCWKTVTPKVVKPPVIRDKPSHTREIRAIEDNGKELIFESTVLAAKHYGISRYAIQKQCRGITRKSRQGVIFQWINPEPTLPDRTPHRVLCVDDGRTWDSASACARDLGVGYSNVSNAVKGKQKTVKGLTLKAIT